MTENIRINFEQMNRPLSFGPLHPSLMGCPFESFNPHEYRRKMGRRPRTFKPVLAQIFEKDNSAHSINYRYEAAKRKEMKFYKMFTNHMNETAEPKQVDLLIAKSEASEVLCDVAFDGNTFRVQQLIESGVSPNSFDSHQRTPLHIAVSRGHRSLVELLLKKGADPNLTDGLGNSCLHLAACTHDVEICLLLTQHGAKVDVSDSRGRSPIDIARSKLRMYTANPNLLTKSKVEEITNMVFVLLAKKRAEDRTHAALLENCHNRLQVASNPAEMSDGLDSLSRILDQMESLSIDSK